MTTTALATDQARQTLSETIREITHFGANPEGTFILETPYLEVEPVKRTEATIDE